MFCPLSPGIRVFFSSSFVERKVRFVNDRNRVDSCFCTSVSYGFAFSVIGIVSISLSVCRYPIEVDSHSISNTYSFEITGFRFRTAQVSPALDVPVYLVQDFSALDFMQDVLLQISVRSPASGSLQELLLQIIYHEAPGFRLPRSESPASGIGKISGFRFLS